METVSLHPHLPYRVTTLVASVLERSRRGYRILLSRGRCDSTRLMPFLAVTRPWFVPMYLVHEVWFLSLSVGNLVACHAGIDHPFRKQRDDHPYRKQRDDHPYRFLGKCSTSLSAAPARRRLRCGRVRVIRFGCRAPGTCGHTMSCTR